MCYLFLYYLLLDDFLNKAVDMLKKIFIQGHVNLQFFFTIFRKSNIPSFTYFAQMCLSSLDKQLLNMQKAVMMPVQTFLGWLLLFTDVAKALYLYKHSCQ